MRHWLSLVLLFALAPAASAQHFDEPWRWVHFTSESGLPSNNVYDVIETPDSTLWAVCEAGLAWYDGFQWQRVQIPSSSLPSRIGLTTDFRGDSLLVGVGHEYYVGGKSGFSKLPLSEDIQGVAFLSGDTLLVQKNNSLLYVRNGVLCPFEASQELTRGKINQILRTTNGRVWITTKDGIYRWENGDWQLTFPTHGELPLSVQIVQNSKDVALIYIEMPPKWRGLWQWSPDSRAVHRISGTADDIQTLAIGPSEEVVVGYHSGEVLFHMRASWSTSLTLQSKTKHMHNLLYRRNGDLVIVATDGIHYFRASSSRWRVLRYGTSNTWEDVNEILKTRRGDVWIAMGNGIVVYGSDGTKKLITRIGAAPMVAVTGLAEDQDGNIWISSGGSFGGAYRWNGSTWKHFQITADSDESRFHKIRKDRHGRLWFLGISKLTFQPGAKDPGAFVYDGKTFAHWGTEQGLLHGRVYAFAENAAGALWFGTHFGISKWNNGQWQHWTKAQGLRTGHIFTLAVDRHNNVWFGHQASGGGLGCIDSSGKVTYYTTEDGLINDFVRDVQVDSQGVLWISTDGGLASYDHGVWSRFDENTGLQYNLLWPILPLTDKVYVGTRGQGVAILNRQESITPAPRIVINKPIIEKQDVHLRWNAYSYWGEVFPSDIATRYRIDDGGWSDWNKIHEMKLENCSAGEHSVFIVARGLFRDYHEQGQRATFTVPPPLYLQPIVLHPALVLVAGLIGLGVVLVVRKRRYDSDLRQREAKFRAVTETTSSAIFIYDRSHIYFMNSSAEALTGYRLEDTTTMSMNDLILSEDQALFSKHCLLADSVARQRHRSEIRITTRSGDTRWLDFTSGPMTYQSAEMVLGTAFDITERKAADEKLRSLTSELISTEERERHRVAIFLHDEIGQALGLCKIKLRSMQKSNLLINNEPNLREILHLVEDSIKNTRSLTFDLSPPILYDLDFPAALKLLAEQLLEHHSIQLEFSSDGKPIALKDEIKVVAYHMVREIVINTIKHAQAQRVTLDLTARDGRLFIAVADDGIGFKTECGEGIPESQRGFGLFNVRERLSHLGGSLELHSSEGQGTRATISIPITAPTMDRQKEST